MTGEFYPSNTRMRHYSRRDFMRIGALSIGGLTLGELLQRQAYAGEVRTEAMAGTRKPGRIKNVIQIVLQGGCPHQESWDPKPEAPVEYRGPLGVVKTNIPGIVFGECLPRTAKIANKLTVIRSITGRIPDHAQAMYHQMTGYLPTAAIKHPSIGAIVAHEFGPRANLPPYIAIPNIGNDDAFGTGYLSSKYGAFELGSDPGSKNFMVRDVSLARGVGDKQFTRRRTVRDAVEAHFKSLETDSGALETMDAFYQRAYDLISSPAAQAAFTMDGEPKDMEALYGNYVNPTNKQPLGVGQRFIMARRLIEAGVRFVTVNYGSWDLHVQLKEGVTTQLPAFDHAFAGLITDLEQRKLLDDTLVMVATEFGRSPKFNTTAGRDHHARCFSLVLAGGGFKPCIYGSTNATASEVADNPVTIEDYLYTIYHQLGIDADDRLLAAGDRPIDIIRGGKLVKGLLA